jgi:HEAT repeat protein
VIAAAPEVRPAVTPARSPSLPGGARAPVGGGGGLTVTRRSAQPPAPPPAAIEPAPAEVAPRAPAPPRAVPAGPPAAEPPQVPPARAGLALTAPANLPRAAAPTLEAPRDALSPAIAQWLAELSRAVRGSRLYADNNATFRAFVATAFRQLEQLLQQRAQLRLTVHEDRLTSGEDAVHSDTDRLSGLPSVLFRSGFREVVFSRGIAADEFLAIIRAIGGEYGRAHVTGEDLITVLWRLAPPHFQYVAARLLTKTSKVHRARAQDKAPASAEGIVAALSAAAPVPEDIRSFLAGSPEEVLAFERWYGVPIADLALMRTATTLNQAATHPLELEEVVLELQRQDEPVELTIRLFDLLLDAVGDAESGEDEGSFPVLLQLHDALVEAGSFASLAALVGRLASHAAGDAAETAPERAELVRALVPRLASPERVRRVYGAYADATAGEAPDTPRTTAILALLSTLARFDAGPLFEGLDAVPRSPARRAVIDALARVEPPTAASLARWIAATKSGPVLADLLALSALLPPAQGLPLVARAVRHPEPAVRAEALRVARTYDDGQVDGLAIGRLADPDRAVRLAAVEIARQRRSPELFAAVDEAMVQEDFVGRDAEELRAWCSAVTAMASYRAVPALSRLLAPSLLGRIMPSVDANLAAIEALGTIDHPQARAQLTKALRSLNKTVRGAAKRALEQSEFLGYRDPEAPPAEAAEPARALVRVAQPPTPEAFNQEVRGVIASLFDDDEGAGGHDP